MASTKTIWPLSRDYVDAVENPRTCFVDADLLHYISAVDKFGMPIVSSGQFAYVFKLNRPNSNGSLAVRCFRGFIAERGKRYNAISGHLNTSKPTALSSFKFEPHGIRVNGNSYPLLVMEWIDGPTLDVYLDKVMGKRDVILHLADQWIKLVRSLGKAQIAHGDLQHGNIIVHKGGLRLVDFDGMFVPAMQGWKAIELGHRHYQHPMRDANVFSASLDNFSTLVIHLSLAALAHNPSLWAHYHDENLIFKKDDFLDPSQSSLFRTLKDMGGECKRLAEVLERACTENVAACPSLLELANPRSELPVWMTEPLDAVVETKTREVSHAHFPLRPPLTAPPQRASQVRRTGVSVPTVARPAAPQTTRPVKINQALDGTIGAFVVLSVIAIVLLFVVLILGV